MQVLALLAVFILAACSPTPYIMKTEFNQNDFAPYARPGKGEIGGEAKLVTPSGNVDKGVGKPIILLPETAYTVEMLDAVQKDLLPIVDDRLKQYVKCSISNTDGYFSFTDLPAGKYILIAGGDSGMVPATGKLPDILSELSGQYLIIDHLAVKGR